MTKMYSPSPQKDPSLKDAKPALLIYLNDARRCAEYRYTDNDGWPRPLGIPAMSAALSVLVALGEILIDRDRSHNNKQSTDKACIKKIFPILRKCSAGNEWYGELTNSSDDDISTDLWEIRNAIVHAAALPDNFELLPEKGDCRPDNKEYRNIFLLPFIDAVEMTMNSLDDQLPFTPVCRYSRRSLISITAPRQENSSSMGDTMNPAGTAGEPRKH